MGNSSLKREFHKIADIFPMMNAGEYVALADDIKAKGLLEPITLFENQILDGRNRYKACMELGVDPKYKEWSGDDPVGYIISENLHRRHLNESQRAMVAARLANMRQGERTDIVEISTKSISQTEAGNLLNVSRESVILAKKILGKGTEELIKAVDTGQMAVSNAAKIAKEVPVEEQSELVLEAQKTKNPQNALRKYREKQRMSRFQEQDLPQGKFQIILADPPWQYEHSIADSRKIETKYPTMELDKICELPISGLCADSAVLFLWVTSPKLEEGLKVVTSWGFNYRTCAVWVKDSIGMGYYVRQRHELLLIAAKGEAMLPLSENRADSVIESPRGEHSEKPVKVYQMIDKMYPGFKKVELFARRAYSAEWATWGNEEIE